MRTDGGPSPFRFATAAVLGGRLHPTPPPGGAVPPDRAVTPMPDTLSLATLGVGVRIVCTEAKVLTVLLAHYGWMRQPAETVDLAYTITRANGRLQLAREGRRPVNASDAGEVLLLLDQDLIIQLQLRRPDLYFVHAGVLDHGGRAFMLVAPSGGGKSTTTWGLVHHGCRYLSDELAPVDLRWLTVHPYPRAIALKRVPPRSYPLPRGTLSTSRGFHIATDALASGIRATPAPLAAIFFLSYVPAARGPSITPISAGQAGARLYANVLNALAHPHDGLAAAVRIACETACFHVSTAEIGATCALVTATLDGLRS